MQTKDPGKPLAGKVAIVTGAGDPRGMGHAASMALAKGGANVVVTDLGEKRDDLSVEGVLEVSGSLSRLQERAAEIEALGVKALAVTVDVTKLEDIEKCVQMTCETFGGVDILFNNAGVIVGAGPFMEVPDSAWDLQFQVTCKGVADFSHTVIPVMKERGGGSIINNSSIAALKALKNCSAYNTVKAGLIGLTKAIAIEHGCDNIRCNAICPGPILTQLNPSRAKRLAKFHNITEDEARKMMVEPIALGRFGEPEEIGAVVAFLASDAASYITGVALPVDGGSMEGL